MKELLCGALGAAGKRRRECSLTYNVAGVGFCSDGALQRQAKLEVTPFLRAILLDASTPADGYPYDLAAVRAVDEIAFGQVTMLVGDNGTGKSTIIEAIAVKTGFNAEGGSKNLLFDTHPTHSGLSSHLELVWNLRPRWGWFLRAETFYGMATHIAVDPSLQTTFPLLHEESHGESFLDLARDRFDGTGFYLLDEPEAALSFQGQLRLLRIIRDSIEEGSQFVIATHSPILMAYPGAVIVELDSDGIRTISFQDVEAVQLWRGFLDEPAVFLRHLLED